MAAGAVRRGLTGAHAVLAQGGDDGRRVAIQAEELMGEALPRELLHRAGEDFDARGAGVAGHLGQRDGRGLAAGEHLHHGLVAAQARQPHGQEGGGQRGVKVLGDVTEGPALLDPALAEQRDLVAQALDHVHLVRDDKDGQAQAAGEVVDEGEDPLGAGGVQRRCRLVAQQHVRVGGEGAGDAHPLALAAGKLCRVGVLEPLEAHEGEQLGGAAAALLGTGAGHLERVGHVVQRRPRREEVGVLEDHADAPPGVQQAPGGDAGQVLPAHGHGALGGRLEQGQAAHEGRLAGARLADDPVDAARRDAQVDAAQRMDLPPSLAEGLAQPADLDHGGAMAGGGRGDGR